MKAPGKILAYFAAVIVLAAALSPPAYWGVQWLAGHGVLTSLGDFPFHRFFNRCAQFFALVLLWPAIRWLNIRSLSELGLQKNPQGPRDFGAGFLCAVLPVVIMAVIYLVLDVYRIKKEHEWVGVLRILFTAGAVSCLEEFLFRGVFLGLAVRAFGIFPGAAVVSFFFAFVHFLRSAHPDEVEAVGWGSGFLQITRVLDGAPALHLLLWGFAALFLAGMILAYAALRTHSLWLPIGIHAGWIISQQGLQWLAKFRIKPPDEYLPWVGPNVVSGAVPTGLAPLLALGVVALLVWLYATRARRAP